jgi:hypothetical protein
MRHRTVQTPRQLFLRIGVPQGIEDAGHDVPFVDWSGMLNHAMDHLLSEMARMADIETLIGVEGEDD